MATGMETTEGRESTLSTWAGPYVTEMLGQARAYGPAGVTKEGQAFGTPFKAYDAKAAEDYSKIAAGLVAGQSDLQTSAFTGIGSLTVPSSLSTASTQAQDIYSSAKDYMPTVGTVQSYMNPYLEAVLEPQMREATRQSDIARRNMQMRMAKAGAYGGGRQAIMESEGQRNLETLLSDITGKGYASAFDTAQKLRQADIDAGIRGLAAQTGATTALTDIGAKEGQFGLSALTEMAKMGQTQRDIDQAEKTAAYAQFMREQEDPLKRLEFQRSMLAGYGLPIATASFYQPAPSTASSIAGGVNTSIELLKILNQLPPEVKKQIFG